MDFRQTFQAGNRNEAPAAPAVTNGAQVSKKDNSGGRKNPLWMTILNLVIVVGVALLVVAVVIAVIFNKPINEQKYVKTSAYQAVFLNNGQVYFGKVNSLNTRYIDMKDVFYLTQASAATSATAATTNSDYTLVKLGCQQIHYPTDQMLINRDQVTFWENLNDSGKVVKSINEFKKQNPNGENCTTTTTGTQSTTSGTNATQNSANTTNNGTTNSTTKTGN